MAEIYNFFGDIWDYLRETYFEADLGSYKNFSVTTQGVTIAQIVFSLFVGFILAASLVVYQRAYLGRMVRRLLERKAQDDASALTLQELGLKRSFLIRYTLRHRDAPLRKVVRYAGETRPDAENSGRGLRMTDRIDYETARFYIPENLQAHAEVRFRSKGTDGRALVIAILVCLLLALLLIRFLPVVLRLADDLITALK